MAGIDEADALRLIASLERASEHPLAQAIVKRRENREPRSAAGRGLRIGDRAGRARATSTAARSRSAAAASWRAFGSVPQALADKADALRAQGKTAMFAAIDGKVAAVHRGRRPDQGDDARSGQGAASAKASASSCSRAIRAQTAEAVAQAARHRRGDRRSAARAEGGEDQGAAGRRAAWSRWRATASTTRRRSRRRTSASRWAPAPTSPSRAPA